jgi:uncharacterized membrane protein (UPF0127 family)
MFKLRLIPSIPRVFALSVIVFATILSVGCSSDKEKVNGVFALDSDRETPEEKSEGLMFRRFLPEGEGALFIYEPPEIVNMWMKDTFIPLDMVFADCDGKIVYIEKNRQPETLEITSSRVPVCYVAELNGGTADRLNLKTGHYLYLGGVIGALKRSVGL